MSGPIPTPISDIRHIRQLMERSRYFTGLSGLSGIAAGLFAVIGVTLLAAYRGAGGLHPVYLSASGVGTHPWGWSMLSFTMVVAACVFLGALGSACYFTRRRMNRLGYPLVDSRTYRLLLNLAIPLVIGGAFCAGLLYQGMGELVPATMLVFYGLALLNGSHFLSEELRVLAYLELGLGLLALFLPVWGLLLWGGGFGILHLIYGAWIYYKYDAHE